MKNKKCLVRITTIYGEEFICILYGSSKRHLYTYNGAIPLDAIKFIDFIGVVV